METITVKNDQVIFSFMENGFIEIVLNDKFKPGYCFKEYIELSQDNMLSLLNMYIKQGFIAIPDNDLKKLSQERDELEAQLKEKEDYITELEHNSVRLRQRIENLHFNETGE